MEYYLEQSLSNSYRDDQVLFLWPELWLEHRFQHWDCDNTFVGLVGQFDLIQRACRGDVRSFWFKEWHIEWTGWKRIVNSDTLVCQWAAYDPDWTGWHLVSSYPGSFMWFKAGFIFDTSLKDGQRVPSTQSTQSELDSMRRDCLYTLLAKIAQIGEPPYDPYKDRQ